MRMHEEPEAPKKILTELSVVRCSEALADGMPCMTLFPHPNAKYYGPCLFCWNRLKAEDEHKKAIEVAIAATEL